MTTPTDGLRLDLDVLAELARKATPGPWHADKNGLYVWAPSEKEGDFPAFDGNIENPDQVVRARGWGYFTGNGHGALGLSQDEAIARQRANVNLVAAVDPQTILALIDMARRAAEKPEPVAWAYEVATGSRRHNGELVWENWQRRVSLAKPDAPAGTIRNLTPLYASPSPAGMKVKALEWHKHQRDDLERYSADPVFASYIITWTASGYELYHGFWGSAGEPRPPFFLTVDDAKAAAQADYEARILSALDQGEPK